MKGPLIMSNAKQMINFILGFSQHLLAPDRQPNEVCDLPEVDGSLPEPLPIVLL